MCVLESHGSCIVHEHPLSRARTAARSIRPLSFCVYDKRMYKQQLEVVVVEKGKAVRDLQQDKLELEAKVCRYDVCTRRSNTAIILMCAHAHTQKIGGGPGGVAGHGAPGADPPQVHAREGGAAIIACRRWLFALKEGGREHTQVKLHMLLLLFCLRTVCDGRWARARRSRRPWRR